MQLLKNVPAARRHCAIDRRPTRVIYGMNVDMRGAERKRALDDISRSARCMQSTTFAAEVDSS